MKKGFVYNKDLPFVKEYEGNEIRDHRFQNENKGYIPRMRDVIKWKVTSNPQRSEKTEEDYLIKPVRDLEGLHSDEDTIIWLGHSTFIIRLNGVNIITDPIFYDLPLIKRQFSPPYKPKELPPIHLILISHSHRDHFDKKSIRALYKRNKKAKILTGLKVGKILNNMPIFPDYQEAGWYQKFSDVPNGIDIHFLPAHHWSRRGAFDMNQTLWGSFMIQSGNRKIYFGGDSAYSDHYREISRLYKDIDVAILPIGAYKPHFLMSKSHLSPKQAVKASNELKAGYFIPMHFGTYDLSDEPMGEPERKIRKYDDKKTFCSQVKILKPGETFTFQRNPIS